MPNVQECESTIDPKYLRPVNTWRGMPFHAVYYECNWMKHNEVFKLAVAVVYQDFMNFQ